MEQLELDFTQIENQEKKRKKAESGRKAQQDGENVKNSLASVLSYTGDAFSHQAQILLTSLGINTNEVSFINTRSHEDKGDTPCSKPDLRCIISNKNGVKYKTINLSVKSTFGSTQVAVHSISTFIKHLATHGVSVPSSVQEFLVHFTNSNNNYDVKPNFIFNESIRRVRYSVNEINLFNPSLFEDTKQFFKENASEILYFLISKGQVTDKKGHANFLAFCGKKLDNLLVVHVDSLINYILEQSLLNDSWIVCNKDKSQSGITTLSLFNGLISLQMKGSGGKETSAYHHLQFGISGNRIKKLTSEKLIKDIVWC